MKIETFVGALIAALIAFLTGAIALLTQDGVADLSDIGQVAWIVLGGGAAITFLKDMQAVWTRQKLANVTGSNNVHSPPTVGIVAMLLACLMLSGCSYLGVTPRPDIDSIPDAIAVTAADVESAAQTVKSLCRNEQPGGPCAATAIISTDQKESLKNGLQDVLDGLSLANLAVANGDDAGAQSVLERTQAILAVLSAELARLQN